MHFEVLRTYLLEDDRVQQCIQHPILIQTPLELSQQLHLETYLPHHPVYRSGIGGGAVHSSWFCRAFYFKPTNSFDKI
jgi:hypothetical protein